MNYIELRLTLHEPSFLFEHITLSLDDKSLL